MKAYHPKYHFPWRPGNRFELLVDGPSFYSRMLQCIDAARRDVLLELYLFESGTVADRFIDALIRAAQRGVVVKLLLDDFGAVGLAAPDRQRLIQGGADLAFYNALHYGKWLGNLLRDHRKLLVVDGETAFVGGAGITDEFDPPQHPQRRWRETMVAIEGPVVADWRELFARLWNQSVGRPLELPAPPATEDRNGQLGRVTVTAALAVQEIKRSVLKRVAKARHRVWIATAYFVPSWRLRRALRRAAQRGVDVRLLLPGPDTDHPAIRHAGRKFYGRLLRDGVRILEYQPRFMHAKVALCDDWVSIGSCNLDRWNLRWNLEANQEVDDPAFAGQVQAAFESDFSDSLEYDYAGWQQRPWRFRLLERLWGTVDLWLERLGHRK